MYNTIKIFNNVRTHFGNIINNLMRLVGTNLIFVILCEPNVSGR